MPLPDATAFFQNLKKGDTVPLPHPLAPGLSTDKVEATVVSVEKGKYWEFDLKWFGVYIGQTYIERKADGTFEWGEL